MSQPLIMIQARRNSTRLHNKINQLIGFKRMIDHVIDRARLTGIKWCLAASWGYPAIAEEDVLGRFMAVLNELDPEGDHYDPIIRLTADCPMVAPWLIRELVALYGQQTPKVLIGTSPEWDGLDCEVIPRSSLARAHALAVEARDKEHVTPFLKRHERYVEIPLNGPALRWSVDDEAGLEFVRQVFLACDLCRTATPHHTNARGSIGGPDRTPIWDLHQVPDGGLEECRAFDLLKTRMGGPVYVSR